MGVDMGTYDELIAHRMTVEEIREHIGADSLHFLSLEGMMRAIGRAERLLQRLFHRAIIPLDVNLTSAKTGFRKDHGLNAGEQ